MESFAPRSLELKPQDTFVQARRNQRFVVFFYFGGLTRVICFLNSREIGKTRSAEGHLCFMAQNGSLFTRNFFGAQKELYGLMTYRDIRPVHEIFPSPDRRTLDC